MGEVKLPISERLREAEGNIVWMQGYTEEGPLLDEGADCIDALYRALVFARSCIRVPHVSQTGAHHDYIREQVEKIDAALAKAESSHGA